MDKPLTQSKAQMLAMLDGMSCSQTYRAKLQLSFACCVFRIFGFLMLGLKDSKIYLSCTLFRFTFVCQAPLHVSGLISSNLTFLRDQHSFEVAFKAAAAKIFRARDYQHVLQDLHRLRSLCTVDPGRSLYSSCLCSPGCQVSATLVRFCSRALTMRKQPGWKISH